MPGPTRVETDALAAGRLLYRAAGDVNEVAEGKLTLGDASHRLIGRRFADRVLCHARVAYRDIAPNRARARPVLPIRLFVVLHIR